MYFRLFLVLLFSIQLFIAGCALLQETDDPLESVENVPSSGYSPQDGTKWIRLSQIFCSDSIMFELYQDSNLASNNMVFLHAGVLSRDDIDSGESLKLTIDGDSFAFESATNLTKHIHVPVSQAAKKQFSYKIYSMPETLIRQTSESNQLIAKINLVNDRFIEEQCFSLRPQDLEDHNSFMNTSTLDGFLQFVAMMNSFSE